MEDLLTLVEDNRQIIKHIKCLYKLINKVIDHVRHEHHEPRSMFETNTNSSNKCSFVFVSNIEHVRGEH